MDLAPRYVGVILTLLALIPGIAFIVLKPALLGVVALVNVVLIAGSLAIAMSPHESETNGHGDANGV